MKIIPFFFILVAATPSFVFAQPGWKVEVQKDDFSDKILTLASVAAVKSSVPKFSSSELIIQCSRSPLRPEKSSVYFALSTERFISTQGQTVQYRLGEGEITDHPVSAARGSKAFIFSTSMNLVKKIEDSKSDRFRLKFGVYNEQDVTLEFNIRGFRAVLDRIEKTCPVRNPE